MKRYKGEYLNESPRLRGWDYSSNGQYFITINTYGRACLFGDVVDGKMILNDFGKIATEEWFSSFEIRQELILGEFILMPNHLHAIIGLESRGGPDGMVDTVGAHGRASQRYPREDHSSQPSSQQTIPDDQTIPTNQYQPQPFERKPKSISSFVAGYKSAVLNKMDDLIDEQQIPMQKFNRRNPLWQANYYDHIIRNRLAYQNISEYIRRNPEKWEGG